MYSRNNMQARNKSHIYISIYFFLSFLEFYALIILATCTRHYYSSQL